MAQYLKQDSELGYVEDVAEIEHLKFNNLRHTILGCMLGDYDETGAYVVSPEIVEELIEMKKYIVDNYDNIEICRSELKLDKQITFMVTFEGNKATLSLLEKLSYEANFKLNSGSYSNINEYVLDYVETSGEINRNMVYQRWNIGVYGGNIIDIFNCEESVLAKYLGVVNRFKYLLEANKKLLQKEEVLEEIEAGYSNELLTILNSYPKLKDIVLKQVKETLEEKKNTLSINKPNFAKTFNEVLENSIVANINVLKEEEKEAFEKDKRNAIVNTNIKKAEVVEVEHKKEDEQTPAIVRLDVPDTVETKSVQELGEDFVKEHQRVIAKYQPTVEAGIEPKNPKVPINPESERNKLIGTLVGAGLGAVLGGAAGMVVGAVTGAVVAETVEEAKDVLKDAKKTVGQQKGVGGKTSTTGTSKSGGKKQEKSANGNTSNKKQSQQVVTNPIVVADTYGDDSNLGRTDGENGVMTTVDSLLQVMLDKISAKTTQRVQDTQLLSSGELTEALARIGAEKSNKNKSQLSAEAIYGNLQNPETSADAMV